MVSALLMRCIMVMSEAMAPMSEAMALRVFMVVGRLVWCYWAAAVVVTPI